MIVEWLTAVGASFMTFIADLIPEWTPPEWFVEIGPQIAAIIAPADGLGVWVNFSLAGTVASAVIATYVVSFVVKLFLRAGSHVPQFGGSG